MNQLALDNSDLNVDESNCFNLNASEVLRSSCGIDSNERNCDTSKSFGQKSISLERFTNLSADVLARNISIIHIKKIERENVLNFMQ